MSIPYTSTPGFIQYHIDKAYSESPSCGRLYEELVNYQRERVQLLLADQIPDNETVDRYGNLENYTWKQFVGIWVGDPRERFEYCIHVDELRKKGDLGPSEFDECITRLQRSCYVKIEKKENDDGVYLSIDNGVVIYPLMYVFFAERMDRDIHAENHYWPKEPGV